MKLKELRESAEIACAEQRTVYVGNAQELVEDIDRSNTEAYEAGVKNGKSLALLTIKADEESARQEGYQAGHAAANVALNKANEELGQQRVVIRDLSERNRTLEERDNKANYREWFSKGYEAATGKTEPGCFVLWRGSVSDLATDLRALLRQEEIGILIDELTTGRTKNGAKTYAYEKVEQLRTETAEKLDKLWVMVQEQIHTVRLGSSEKHSDQRIEQLEKRCSDLADRVKKLEFRRARMGEALTAPIPDGM